MIRNSHLGCQYCDLRTKFHIKRWSIQPSLSNKPGTADETWRSELRSTWKGLPPIVSVTLYACVKPRGPQCSSVNGKNGHEGTGVPRDFVTTRWSLILSAANLGSEEQKVRDAL